jgi:acyl-CoA thioesterase
MLEVEDRGEGVYGARLESFWGVASPGDAFARAALAASEGASAPLSSLQATMLGVARPDQFLSLEPEELGPELRRVRVRDSAALVCDVMLRFSHERDGLTYQSAGAGLEVPAPEDLPSEAQVAAAEGWSQYAVGPIESRRIGEHRYVEEHEPAEWLGWLQPRESVDEAALRTPALVFLSEYRSHWGIELRLGRDFPKYQLDLLDFAVWIHRPQQWSDWWLVRTSTEVGSGGRCLSRREISTRDGQRVASSAWQTRVTRA